MPALFFSLLACVLASLGGRDLALVAHHAVQRGGGATLIATAWLAAAMTASLAAAAGWGIAVLLPPQAKLMLVAFALLAASIEMTLLRRPLTSDAPVRSTPFLFVQLVAAQIGDGARFLVLAVAVVAGEPVLAAIGGTLGSGAMLTLTHALAGQAESRWPWRTVRRGVALVLGVVGLVIALYARGILV